MNEAPWYEIGIANGDLEIRSTESKGFTPPPINLAQAAVIYTYAKAHAVIRIQFAPDAIRLEHKDGLVERFLTFADLEKEVAKIDKNVELKVMGDYAKKKLSKVTWRTSTEPRDIVRLFPKTPTADEVLELHQRNQTLRSNLLENFTKLVTQRIK